MVMKDIIGKIIRFLDSSDNQAHNLLKSSLCPQLVLYSTGTFMILGIPYSEYVLYALYACMHTQLASPAESGMTIILRKLCISTPEAIRKGDQPYMQHQLLHEPD